MIRCSALLASLAVVLPLAGCCLEKITLAAPIDAVNAPAASVGLITPTATFDFADCCPTGEQKVLAQRLRDRTFEAFDEFMMSKRTPEDRERYEEVVELAHTTLNKVILVCAARADPEVDVREVASLFAAEGETYADVLASYEYGMRPPTREEILEDLERQAWQDVEALVGSGA